MKKTVRISVVMLTLVLSAFYLPANAEANSAGVAAAIIGGAIITTAAIAAAHYAYACAPPYPRAVRVAPAYRVVVAAPPGYYAPRRVWCRPYVYPRARTVRVVPPPRPRW